MLAATALQAASLLHVRQPAASPALLGRRRTAGPQAVSPVRLGRRHLLGPQPAPYAPPTPMQYKAPPPVRLAPYVLLQRQDLVAASLMRARHISFPSLAWLVWDRPARLVSQFALCHAIWVSHGKTSATLPSAPLEVSLASPSTLPWATTAMQTTIWPQQR